MHLAPWIREAPLAQGLYLLRFYLQQRLKLGSDNYGQHHKAPYEQRPPAELVVSWNGPDDPEHPRNWSRLAKAIATGILCLYSFIVYCGSSICVVAYDALMMRYGKSREVVSLMLSLYVVGYGIGPLLFAPLSEIPHIGRNPPYIVSFAVFVAISLVLGAVDNFPAIAVLRFFQGLFGSPCLATTGASIRDLYGDPMSSYGLFIWILGLFAGPALGPAFASHAVQENWRWPFWQISCMAIPCFVLMLVSLPETSANTLLLRRARRLGREMRSISRGEGETCRISLAQGLQQHDVQDYRQFWRYMGNSMIKPLEIMIKDPAIAFVTVYASFTYAIYYSFFEAFAIVYRETYQMGLVGFSLQFLAIVVGSVIGAAVYGIYLFRTIKSRQGDQPQEIELVPALPAVLFPPIGLYIFAFAARTDVHWIVPGCGIAVYAASLFLIYQAILIYIPLSYPYYAASMFAANDFARSLTATGFIMATPYMYENLGVRDGVVILASISILGIPGMLVLYRCGQRLRDRSKFTANTV